jgi:V/A-type H+-transporting ATPase subunit E
MQSKLQELTDKIYQEGLDKGNEEAKAIIESAKKEAAEIIESAKKQASGIIDDAQKNAAETLKNTESEIKLSSKQAINSLKQEITDTINDKVIQQATGKAFDTAFLKTVVETTLKNWSASQSSDISILLPAEQEKELSGAFSKSVKDLLDKGLEIKFTNTVKAGFQISPKDGSYKVSFTELDFENFFKQYLRPKLIDILFQE